MVYCGRPSLACHACRKVSAKCDKRRPCCGQCLRKSIPCPGYWDPNTVVIRDQTRATIRKAAAKDPTKYTGSANEPAPRQTQFQLQQVRQKRHETTTTTPVPMDQVQPLPPVTLSPTLEECAITFFWSFYAPNTSLSSLFVMTQDGVPDTLPLSVIIAPALAMMSQDMNQPGLMDAGRKYYNTAIRDISQAIESLDVAKQDTTLISVLLISLFDSIAPKFNDSSRNWATHVDGAVQLVRLRGQDQLNSPLGRAMLSDVSGTVYTSCVQRRIPVPDVISQMRDLLHERHGDDPGIELGRVAESMLKLTIQMRSPDAAGGVAPLELLSEASRISDQLTTLLSDLGQRRPFAVRRLAAPDEATYDNTVHDYESPQAARHWNVLRLMKMFVSKWMFRAATTLHALWNEQQHEFPFLDGCSSSYLAISQTAALDAEAMAADILRSVPFYRTQPSWQNTTSGTGRWLIWPLSYISASELAPMSARIHAQAVLRELCKSGEALEDAGAEGQLLQLGNSFHLYHIS